MVTSLRFPTRISGRVWGSVDLPRRSRGDPVHRVRLATEERAGPGRLVGEKLWAVICPVAPRITPGLAGWFSTATIVVADEREGARIAKHTRPGQRVKIIESGPLPAA